MKSEEKEKIPFITVYSIEDWRKWLNKNHLKEKKVGMICYKKHTGKPSISHKIAMEEAIAFGWIDTTINRLDEEKYIRYFVRRGDNANWSKNTLKYGKKLLAEGRMSPHGELRFKQGLKKKPHDYGIPDKPPMPADLKKALAEKKIIEKFEAFPPSTKNMFYRWILRAKTDATKKKRIESVVKRTIEGNKTTFAA